MRDPPLPPRRVGVAAPVGGRAPGRARACGRKQAASCSDGGALGDSEGPRSLLLDLPAAQTLLKSSEEGEFSVWHKKQLICKKTLSGYPSPEEVISLLKEALG